jgi:hypothetical protein
VKLSLGRVQETISVRVSSRDMAVDVGMTVRVDFTGER